MRILLLYTDADFYAGAGYDRAWRAALEEEGSEVDVLPGPDPAWAVGGPPTDRWDLVIAHVLVEEVAAFAPTLRAAALLEAAGIPLLNPTHAISVSSDKLTTHAVWAAHGIRQPAVWDAEEIDEWPAEPGSRLVLKPSFCDGARHIELVSSLDEARAVVAAWRRDEAAGGERRGTALLQEWIEEPAAVRLFATPDDVSLAYQKSRRPGDLVTHGTVYPEVYEPPPAMAELARAMVASLGGGLMGVDVLTDRSGEYWALEANAPFGFDVSDPEQGRWVARAAVRAAERATGTPAG